MNMILSR